MPDAYSALYFTVYHLTRAVLAPIQRDSFIYWPFLLSSVVLAIGVWRWQKVSWAQFRQAHLSRALWWHASARADYRLYFVNALIFPAVAASLIASPAGLARWGDALLGFVAVPAQAVSDLGWQLAYTLVFFVAYDLGRYLAHSLLHAVPALWEFHKVHHSAQVLTPITAFRVHPVDLWVMAWGSALTTGVATWLFNHAAGGPVNLMLFMGVHALLWASNLTGNLNHSSLWLSFGPRWGRWLISPAHHQLHHSAEQRHWGCNRGFALAVWDRLFGSLYVPGHMQEHFALGLGDGSEPRWHNVRYMLIEPFRALFRRKSGRTVESTDLR